MIPFPRTHELELLRHVSPRVADVVFFQNLKSHAASAKFTPQHESRRSRPDDNHWPARFFCHQSLMNSASRKNQTSAPTASNSAVALSPSYVVEISGVNQRPDNPIEAWMKRSLSGSVQRRNTSVPFRVIFRRGGVK